MPTANPHQTRHRKRHSPHAEPYDGVARPAKKSRNDGGRDRQKKSGDTPAGCQVTQVNVDGRKSSAVTLPDGTHVLANDCVYLVSETPEEPYNIARMMELARVRPDSTDVDGVRVNWFYRQRDVQNRDVHDSRLLYATMHSDVVPLRAIRGLCLVQHRSEIPDLDVHRTRPDHFHYDRLFDKFVHRTYEVVPVAQISNVPDDVRHVLSERWRFVVVEPNFAKDLAMERRICSRCTLWCSTRDSIRCSKCLQDFHMHCLDPPMTRKPTRGFAWSCARCVKAEIEGREASPGQSRGRQALVHLSDSPPSPRTDRADPKIRPSGRNGARKASVASRELWPFRYLGIHCNLEDVVDADDRIYPRAATRIGARYQVNITDDLRPYQETCEGGKLERGTEETCDVMNLPFQLSEAERQLRLCKRKDIADLLGTSLEDPDVLDICLSGRPHPSLRPSWTPEERSAFSTAVRRHGANLRKVHQSVPSRSLTECVRFFYLWKISEEGRICTRQHRQHVADDAAVFLDATDASRFDAARARRHGKEFQCMRCETKSSDAWYLAPEDAADGATVVAALCRRCAELWYKYAVEWESIETLQRRQADSLSKVRRTKVFEHELMKDLLAQQAASDIAASSVDGRRGRDSAVTGTRPEAAGRTCAICQSLAPDAEMTCVDCGGNVHKACYGLHGSCDVNWRCEACSDSCAAVRSSDQRCVLCPIDTGAISLKPTTGHNWAHVYCAIWNLDLFFGDELALSPVDGIASLPPLYWESICSICGEASGACVACTQCDTPLHVGCALATSCRLAFEITPVKSTQSRRENVPTVRIGTEHGLLRPIIFCKEHGEHTSMLHSPEETVPGTAENILSLYAKTYRASDSDRLVLSDGSVRVQHTANLRRQKLLALKQSAVAVPPASGGPMTVSVELGPARSFEIACGRCGVTASPAWQDVLGRRICHVCYWKLSASQS